MSPTMRHRVIIVLRWTKLACGIVLIIIGIAVYAVQPHGWMAIPLLLLADLCFFLPDPRDPDEPDLMTRCMAYKKQLEQAKSTDSSEYDGQSGHVTDDGRKN
ncbi:hypothetical protein [Bifidobacterium choloepi]|uniref:Uncharacterized protein n=1 Tax=Bifidobacterium choloepi TaxID=2614131 RepID=A0A6I5MZF5_9BIFI|nr:hypothetical protein [Bifidobacterium choloepi]NEG69205.1 hypothetical protein [Bifidobacterium choloepi]